MWRESEEQREREVKRLRRKMVNTNVNSVIMKQVNQVTLEHI